MKNLQNAQSLTALLLLAASVAGAQTDEARLELRPNDRICLVGNTFAERFQLFGYFESELLAAFPNLELSVRNLAWSADEASLMPRPLEFGPVERHLEEAGADVVLLFYGANESFAGATGIPAFSAGLGRLIRRISERSSSSAEPRRLAVVSPIPQEAFASGRGLDADAVARRNEELLAYSEAAAGVAAEHGAAFLDIFDDLAEAYAATTEPMTMNGMHLNESGYRHAARALIEALGRPPPGVIHASARGEAEFTLRPTVQVPGPKSEVVPPRLVVADLDAGYYELRGGDGVLASADHTAWAEGVVLPTSAAAPLFDRGRQLRNAVLQKSRLFFDRYRAVNGYYIYGGRKEPFGVHSFPPEMERFDELVNELEDEATELARSSETWQLLRVDR